MKKTAVVILAVVALAATGCKKKEEAPQGMAPQGGMPAQQMPAAQPGGGDPHAGLKLQEIPAGVGHKGKVVQTMDAAGYTYIEVEEKGQKLWVAVMQTKVKVGDDVVFGPGQEMVNFKSDTLKRTFDRIIFSSGPMALPGTTGDKTAKPKPKKGAAIKVEKAAGKNAYTVSELYAGRAKLDNKDVTVRGRVVKVSENIMGKTWIHIQDGTGSAEQGTHNLVCTTSTGKASVGDTVTVTGVLKKDKDFGYGYKYDVMLEDATVH